MPVTRADEMDARPADNAKELLALADKLDNSRHLDCFDEAMVVMTLAERDLVISALRLSARQQASVEEVALLLGNRHRDRHGLPPVKEMIGGGWEQTEADARALLAKYDIFQKVEG